MVDELNMKFIDSSNCAAVWQETNTKTTTTHTSTVRLNQQKKT